MHRRFLDHEVGIRLLKGFDLAILSASSFGLCIVLNGEANAATPALAGSFSLTLAFLCVFFTRGFGLYGAAQMRKLFSNLLKTSLIWAVIGLSAGLGIGLVGLHLTSEWQGLWLIAAGSTIVASLLTVWLAL